MHIHKRNICKIFFILILCIYIFFIFIDFITKTTGTTYSIVSKYSSILLCFFFSFVIANDGYTPKDMYLLQLGLFFTTVADFFLLFTDQFEIGILFFCIVQLIYIFRYQPTLKLSTRNKFLFLFLLFFIFLSLAFLRPDSIGQRLYITASIYALLLLISVYSSIEKARKKDIPMFNDYLCAIGMVLFFLCDLNVGLFHLLVNTPWAFYIGFLMWFFYLPAQLFLVLSGINITK